MSKKKKSNKNQKRCNYQPKDDTQIFVGEVYKEKFVENLQRYPEDVVECIWIDGGYQQISGHSIQLPITGNMYGLNTMKASKSWAKVTADFVFYMTQKFTIRLFCVPAANFLFVATEAPIEEVENICHAIMEMNGFDEDS